MNEKISEEHSPELSNTSIGAKKIWLYCITSLIALIAVWNALIFYPVSKALETEDDASIIAYRQWLVSPSQIVIDVRSVEPTQSMVGMDRMLFKAAEALKDNSFERVILAHRGTGKFLVPGDYFQEIGQTYQTQNPVYTMRTMQERIQKPDGTPAFDSWSGGWLGVFAKQLEDHNQFHKEWWLNGEIEHINSRP